MMLHGNGGAGYVRVDWFTPDGLSTWGDGRLFILGTEGYIELRKYIDIAGRKAGNHLFIVDKTQTRYLDCGNVMLPFGPQLVSDVVNRDPHRAEPGTGSSCHGACAAGAETCEAAELYFVTFQTSMD